MKKSSFLELVFLENLKKSTNCHLDTQASDLPGTPDILIRDIKLVIFINGCYWHGHNCISKHSASFDQDREINIIRKLKSQGYCVLIIWECDILKDIDACIVRAKSYIKSLSQNLE